MTEGRPRAISIKISGMHCQNCALAIERELRSLDGVMEANVSFASGKALVIAEPRRLSADELERAIRRLGYGVEREKVRLRLREAVDPTLAAKLEVELSKLEGVRRASVDAATGLVTVEYLPGFSSERDVIRVITDLGLRVTEEVTEPSEGPESGLRAMALLGLALAIPIMLCNNHIISGMMPLGGTPDSAYLLFALATAVQLGIGRRFYQGAIRAARAGTANMDTLVSLGTTSAYLLSVWHTFPVPDWRYIYYDSSAAVIAFVLVGKYLEERMRGRTSAAIRKILEAQPKTARVIRGGEVIKIPTAAVRAGDIVLVAPGERVPVDGVVVGGSSWVDESLLTGESTPVSKGPGDEVVGGSIVLESPLRVRATRVGEEAFVGRVAALVEEALERKPAIQRTVDRIAGLFAYAVMGVAGVTLAGWLAVGADLGRAVINAVSVLVVACPCALGLATPTATAVGIGRAASLGVLFRRAEAVEVASRVSCVVLDKTGTLTEGRPRVVEAWTAPGWSEGEVLTLAAAAEYLSPHPLAEAIVRRAVDLGLEVGEPEDLTVVPGAGVRATVRGRRVVVGSVSMVGREVELDDSTEAAVEAMRSRGETVVAVGVDGELAGILGLRDEPKRGARESVEELKAMGLRVIMLTGDSEATARAIAEELGIDEFRAEVTPEGKVEAIAELQEEGCAVAMVGDGFNDAPALSRADLGVAIGGGTDVAVEAGDVILIRDDPRDVAAALKIGRRVVRQIRQNLAWAFAYNVVLIPLAASGILYPVYAGLAMAMSSISVTGWSLTLARYRP